MLSYFVGTFCLGWKDSNLRMAGPKPAALPLGHTPYFFVFFITNFKMNSTKSQSSFLLFQRVYSILFSKSGPPETDLDSLVGFCEGDGGCCHQQKTNKKTPDFSYRITHYSKSVRFWGWDFSKSFANRRL